MCDADADADAACRAALLFTRMHKESLLSEPICALIVEFTGNRKIERRPVVVRVFNKSRRYKRLQLTNHKKSI